jgi:hypothetical protein
MSFKCINEIDTRITVKHNEYTSVQWYNFHSTMHSHVSWHLKHILNSIVFFDLIALSAILTCELCGFHIIWDRIIFVDHLLFNYGYYKALTKRFHNNTCSSCVLIKYVYQEVHCCIQIWLSSDVTIDISLVGLNM